jgi:hypothetical protein
VTIAKKSGREGRGGTTVFAPMVRVLASLIVVCLVAATGVRPVAVAPEPRPTLKVARGSERLHARLVESVQRVVSPASGAARVARAAGAAGSHEVPAVVDASGLALAPVGACSVGPTAREAVVVVSRVISTCSARGPPVV